MAGEEEQFVFYMPLIEERKNEEFSAQRHDLGKAIPVSIDQINGLVEGLNDYSLDTIELHVTGVLKSGPLTQLFIGAEGEAGMKLVLNKKKS